MIRKLQKIAVVAVLSTMALSGKALALQQLTLPNPVGSAFLYGDFYSYSLPILAYKYDYTYGGGVGPGNPFYVSSTPGAIMNGIVIATGASGTDVNTNFAGMDNAYATPNGHGGSPYFRTGDPTSAPDPGPLPAILGGQTNTWDTTLTALTSFLNGSTPIFYFNNNQTKESEDLYAWAQIAIRDIDGNKPTLYFDMTSPSNDHTGIPVISSAINPSIYTSPGAANTTYPSVADDNTKYPDFGNFVLSGGKVCTDATASFLVPCGTPGSVEFNHNLGANQAAYALVSPEINAILSMPGFDGYDVMSMDIRMTGLNNGYEQIFILPSSAPSTVPEPATLTLFGIGLAGVGLAGVARRRGAKNQ